MQLTKKLDGKIAEIFIKGRTFIHVLDNRNLSAKKIRSTNVGVMLGQRRRRWPNSKPTLVQHLVLESGVDMVHCKDKKQ